MKTLTENMVAEIKEMIIVRGITSSESESIEGIADSFPEMYSNESEYISFQEEIGKMVEEMEFICEICISDAELIRNYYSADADFTADFEKNGVDRELYIDLEIRDGKEYAVSEYMESGSRGQDEDFQAVVDWLNENNIDIVWEEK